MHPRTVAVSVFMTIVMILATINYYFSKGYATWIMAIFILIDGVAFWVTASLVWDWIVATKSGGGQ